MLRMQEIAFLGEYTLRHTPPPNRAWYIGHTRGLQPLLSPFNILSHRKVPFQKMPPTGKSLKKALVRVKYYVRSQTVPMVCAHIM